MQRAGEVSGKVGPEDTTRPSRELGTYPRTMNEMKTMKILRFVHLKATLKHLLAPGQTQNPVWEILFHNACYRAENKGRGGGGVSVETAVSVCVCLSLTQCGSD